MFKKKNYMIKLIFDKKISPSRKQYYCGFANAFSTPHPEECKSPLVFTCDSDSNSDFIAVFSSLHDVEYEVRAIETLIQIDEAFKRPDTKLIPPKIKIVKTKLPAKPFDLDNLVKNAQGIGKGMKDWYEQFVN